MPLLLNVLRNATGADYRKLRVKAMECAGLIGKSSFVVVGQFFSLRFGEQRSPLVEMFFVRMPIRSSSFSCGYKVRPLSIVLRMVFPDLFVGFFR